MLAATLHQFFLAGNHARLRPAQELIAAEGDYIHACAQAGAGQGFLRQTLRREVNQQAAAQVFHQRQATLARQCYQLLQRRALGEADNLEIAGVHAQQQPRPLVEGAGVVGQAGAVGGADFAQHRAAAGHDVGDAEAAADFDQLAARDHHFPAFRQRRQHQQHRGGVVVHHYAGLGAQQTVQELGGVRVALPALAGAQVEFQVGVAGGKIKDLPGSFDAQGRASQVGVQHHAGGVDDRLQRCAQPFTHLRRHFLRQVKEKFAQPRFRKSGADLLAHASQHFSRRPQHQRATRFFRQRAQPLVLQKFVHRRQTPQARSRTRLCAWGHY